MLCTPVHTETTPEVLGVGAYTDINVACWPTALCP